MESWQLLICLIAAFLVEICQADEPGAQPAGNQVPRPVTSNLYIPRGDSDNTRPYIITYNICGRHSGLKVVVQLAMTDSTENETRIALHLGEWTTSTDRRFHAVEAVLVQYEAGTREPCNHVVVVQVKPTEENLVVYLRRVGGPRAGEDHLTYSFPLSRPTPTSPPPSSSEVPGSSSQTEGQVETPDTYKTALPIVAVAGALLLVIVVIIGIGCICFFCKRSKQSRSEPVQSPPSESA